MRHLMKCRKTIFFVLFLMSTLSYSQTKPFVSQPEDLNNPDFSEWITMPGVSGAEYGVYYFRKSIHLLQVPASFIINVSADNRYRLYINGIMVSWGPEVGDLNNWKYETIDIACYLKTGDNIIAAQVWNMGAYRGSRQITNETAFIVQGETSGEKLANTNKTWKVTQDKGYFPLVLSEQIIGGGYIAGATDSIDGNKHPWGWEQLSFDDSNWGNASEIGKGNHTGLNTWRGTRWLLQPRNIPFMEQKKESIPKLLSVKGTTSCKPEDYSGKLNLTIPANSHIELLLDNKVLTMGFPQLITDGGQNAKIRIQYQEAMFSSDGQKGNRNEWEGKTMKGYYDVYISDGGLNRTFQPLWLRVFRYVKLTIETENSPLVIKDFYNLFTAYPFEQKASFTSSDKTLQDIWNVSWHTARLCALETYMDCPYYEQLQYIGDTRIQALISLYVTEDERLAKNAIELLYGSLQPMGLTKSNHPSNSNQIIPPFSLIYILMVHDYFMLRNDSLFVKQYLSGIRFILDWFVNRIDDTGMLGPLTYWNHVDGGTAEFQNGSPPGISEGHSAHMTILLAYAIDQAVEMFNYYGYQCDADNYARISEKLKSSVMRLCFDKNKQLIAETPEKKLFTQHTNSIAILANAFDPETQKNIALKIINDTTLAQAALYFKFYVFQVLKKAGMGDKMLFMFDQWKLCLDNGLSTFPEHDLNSRSDCHAWSAHPMFDLLNITCGIESGSPGFRTITIAPQPGGLKEMNGKFIHPLGEVTVAYQVNKDGKRRSFEIQLPKGLTGNFVFDNQTYKLTEGRNHYEF